MAQKQNGGKRLKQYVVMASESANSLIVCVLNDAWVSSTLCILRWLWFRAVDRCLGGGRFRPRSASPCVEVSLSKALNLTLLQRLAWQLCYQYCVNVCVHV